VTVRVLEIDPGSKRISLTLRLEDRPREEPAPRQELPSEPRQDTRGPRQEARGPRQDTRGPRRERDPEPRPPEVYTSTDEPEEAFTGDATIEDLLSKFGGGKRDRKRRPDDQDEETEEDRYNRRQRDAIRRTLQQMSDDE